MQEGASIVTVMVISIQVVAGTFLEIRNILEMELVMLFKITC